MYAGRTLRSTTAAFQQSVYDTDEIEVSSSNGRPSAAARQAEALQKQQGKALLAALRNPDSTKRLVELSISRFDGLVELSKIFHSNLKSSSKSLLAEVAGRLKALKVEHEGTILKFLVVSMNQYQRTTKSNPGTPQSVKDVHIQLAAAIVALISLRWKMQEDLVKADPSCSDFGPILVVPSFLDFHKLLNYVPLDLQGQILDLLTSWYAELGVDFFGTNVVAAAINCLIPFFTKCADFSEQLLVMVLVGFLWKKHRKLLACFAAKIGMRSYLKDFCGIFKNCAPMMNSIPPFAYQAAAFFNDRCGFHRKVFAFVLDNTSCYVFRLASRYEMRFPVSAPFFDRQSLWKVYFNLGSQSLSFELSAEERPRVFIRIPFTDVVGIRVSLDSREVVEMEIRLCYALSHYYHGWSGGEMAQIGTCDGLIFGLDIKLEDRKYPELFLLEEALLKCFSLRSKSDFKGQWDVHYDVEGPLASGVNSSKVECVDPFQGYQDPVASFPEILMNRSEEEQFYRECVNGFKLLASASLYDTESTNGNGGSLPQNMETDDDLSSDYPVAVPASTNHARSPEILHRTASFQPEVESNLHSDTSFEDPIEVQDIKPSRIPQRSGRIRPAPTYSRTPPRKEKEVCGSFFVRRQNEKEATSKAAIVAVSHKGNGEVYQVGGPFLSTTHQLATSSGTPLRSSFPVFGSTSPTSPGSQIQLQKGILQSYQSQSSSLNPRPFDLHNLSNGLPANRSPSPPPPKVIRSLERAKKDIVTID